MDLWIGIEVDVSTFMNEDFYGGSISPEHHCTASAKSNFLLVGHDKDLHIII